MSTWNEHLRLTLLRFLSGAQGYKANSSILHSAAEDFGLSASRDQIKTELAWLCEQGLVNCHDLAGLTVASLTQRGLDVTAGRCTVPGVQRSSPVG